MTTTPELPGSDPSDLAAPGVPGGPAVLTAEDLAAILRGRGPLTDTELDALDRLDRACLDPDDDPGDDPDCGPPPEWLTLPPEEQRALLGADENLAGLADDPDEDPDPDILDAGFTRHDPAPGATGFAAGGLLDQMLPGADLAWHAGMARQRGLGTLNDDQLIGFLDAARRLGSWSAALEPGRHRRAGRPPRRPRRARGRACGRRAGRGADLDRPVRPGPAGPVPPAGAPAADRRAAGRRDHRPPPRPGHHRRTRASSTTPPRRRWRT